MIYKRGNVYWYKFMWQGQLCANRRSRATTKLLADGICSPYVAGKGRSRHPRAEAISYPQGISAPGVSSRGRSLRFEKTCSKTWTLVSHRHSRL